MLAKILVVEDDPDCLHVLMHTLRTAGFEPIQAYGGEDALRKLASQRIDLVVTDLAMPKMSGVQLIHDIKNNPETAGIPVIAVTAFVWDPIAQSAGHVGCDGFISKPFTTKQLIQEVHNHLQPRT